MRTRNAVILLLALVSPAGAAESLKGECEIQFFATSTLHDFTGTVRCQPFAVDLVGGAGGGKIIPGVEIAVPVEEIDTTNKKRDRQMREMFQYDKFPHIRGTTKDLGPERIRQEIRNGPNATGTVEFTLKIRETERTVRAVVSNLRETGERVTFDVEFPVSLKEYGLKPPAPFFGAIRVGDRITVHVAFRLKHPAPR